MNTGERLVSLSGLQSSSAITHLLAIQAGIGTGDSFYSGTVRVVTSRQEVTVQNKAKRAAVEQESTAPHTATQQKKARHIGAICVVAPQKIAYSFTQPDEVFVLVRNSQTAVVQSAVNSVVAQRKKT